MKYDKYSDDEIALIRAIYSTSKVYGEIRGKLREMLPDRPIRSMEMKALRLHLSKHTAHTPVLDRLPTLSITEPEKAWLACAIDGEGYFGIHPRTKYSYYSTAIGVANTNLQFLEEFKRISGATIYRVLSSQRGQKKTLYSVEITDMPRVYVIIQNVMGYLIIKKNQAKLLARFIEIQDGLIRQKKSFHDKVLQNDEQMSIIAKIHVLNKRGV